MKASNYSEQEILDHFEDGGNVACSVRLQSGNDFTIDLTSREDYEVVKEDIIQEYEMILYTPGSEK